MPRRRVTDERFLTAWQRGASLAEIARDLGLTKSGVTHRASALRRRGEHLKAFPTGKPRDLHDLHDLDAGSLVSTPHELRAQAMAACEYCRGQAEGFRTKPVTLKGWPALYHLPVGPAIRLQARRCAATEVWRGARRESDEAAA